jgi:hypothetical protein
LNLNNHGQKTKTARNIKEATRQKAGREKETRSKLQLMAREIDFKL